MFSKPWELTLNYKRVTDIDRLIDEDCIGNERNPIVNGKTTIVIK